MKRICIIHTGGTITMAKTATGVLAPNMTGEQIDQYVPALNQIANIDHAILFQLDSSDMTPHHWTLIAEAINDRYQDYDGFVVLHGTDTMAYTATALSFMLGNLSKPVIITGSQLPISEIASDGVTNLLHAVQVACTDLSEVCILLGHALLRGNRSKKMSPFSFDAFVSPNIQPLCEVGTELRFSDHCINRRSATLHLQTNMVTHVVVIKIFPGISTSLILDMIPARTKAVIIEGYGTGNFPLGDDGIQAALTHISEQNIIIVIATQCVYGAVEYERYQGGFFAKQLGALSAQDMTSEAALIKLMWVLGQTSNHDDIKRLYHSNLVGELTERETNI